MKNQENKKVVQQKILELQIIQQHAEELQRTLQVLNQQAQEMQKLDESLDNFSKIKGNEQIFSQLGPGVFVEANLNNSKSLMVNIGSEIAIEKSIPEAKELIQDQLNEIGNSMEKTQEQLQKIAIHAQSIQEDLQSLS